MHAVLILVLPKMGLFYLKKFSGEYIMFVNELYIVPSVGTCVKVRITVTLSATKWVNK